MPKKTRKQVELQRFLNQRKDIANEPIDKLLCNAAEEYVAENITASDLMITGEFTRQSEKYYQQFVDRHNKTFGDIDKEEFKPAPLKLRRLIFEETGEFRKPKVGEHFFATGGIPCLAIDDGKYPAMICRVRRTIFYKEIENGKR